MKIFYLLLYLFLILSFIYTFEYYSSKYYYSNINLSTINLTTISNSLIIFSCYYDKRFKSIRLIGVSTRKVNIMCKYIVGNKYKSCDYKYISMSKDSSGRNFKSLYINILVHLYYNTTVPNQIIINNKKYNVINVKKREKRNVLCVTTLKHFASYNLFLQSLDIYNSYGVTDVYIYTSDTNLKIEKFKMLVNIKIYIIYIENEFYINNTFYFGQTVKYNDCLYRNMYTSNYIIYTDFDELIILKKLNNYNKLFTTLIKGDIYYFRSTICPTVSYVENKHFHTINDIHLSKTLNCCILNDFSHRKYIIRSPYKFIKINVHYIDYAYENYNNIFVRENYAYIHHSRIPTYLLMNHCSKWFDDISLKRLLQYKLG